jgi:hypothetical protein
MVSAGEWVTASGTWLNDRNHGLQFKAHFLKTSAPSSIDGIEKYLGSGMIRGIGPVYAKRMVKMFGKDVFDLIEAEPGLVRLSFHRSDQRGKKRRRDFRHDEPDCIRPPEAQTPRMGVGHIIQILNRAFDLPARPVGQFQ